MSSDQALYLVISSDILNVPVLIIQPSTDFVCDSFPSPNNFLIDRAQSLLIGSEGETGLKIV